MSDEQNVRWHKWLTITGGVVASGFVIFGLLMVFGFIVCLGMVVYTYDSNFNAPKRAANAYIDALVAQDFDRAFDMQDTLHGMNDEDEFMAYLAENGLDRIAERGELESSNNNRLDDFYVLLTLGDGTERTMYMHTSNGSRGPVISRHGVLESSNTGPTATPTRLSE